MSSENRWVPLSLCVKGSKHIQKGKSCEDYIDSLKMSAEASDSLTVIAASDGHGSSNAFRSDTGSQKAVDAALEVIRETYVQWLEHFTEDARVQPGRETPSNEARWKMMVSFPPPRFKCIPQEAFVAKVPDRKKDTLSDVFRRELDLGGKRLVRRIIKRWRSKVQHHWEANYPPEGLASRTSKTSVSEGKESTLSNSSGKTWEEREIWKAYGATLLVAGIASSFRFFIQIGDGDILRLRSRREEDPSHRAEDEWWVFPEDDGLMGEETYSLSMKESWKHAQTRFEDRDEGAESTFFFLSTDGYRNSFPTDAGFLKAASDYRNWLLSLEGNKLLVDSETQDIEEQICTWLRETTREGSGDDISLGLLVKTSEIDTVAVDQPAKTTDETGADAGGNSPADNATKELHASSGHSDDALQSGSTHAPEETSSAEHAPSQKTESSSVQSSGSDPEKKTKQETPSPGENQPDSLSDSRSDPDSPGSNSVW